MGPSSLSVFILIFPLFLLFNVGHSHSFDTTIQTKCHEKERVAMLELKADLFDESCIPDGYDGADLKTWTIGGKNGDYCNWDGVECDELSGHVIGLNLYDSCLSGSIDSTSSIFKLDHLQRLDLSFNDFRYSKIPSAICNLSRLEGLDLCDANFLGQIPPEILHLSNLSSLSLCGLGANGLTLKNPSLGDLVQSLVKLEELVLLNVEISASMPDSLFRLTSLQRLALVECKMHGQIPHSLANLTKLEMISLADNQFTGEIFPQLERLTKLIHIELSSNKFSGQIPRTISHLKNLMYLHLDSNNFSGKTHLDVFLQLDSLQESHLSFNKFSLVVDSSIKPRSKLSYLRLASCNLRSFPLFLQTQNGLELLDLSYNSISGEIPRWFMGVSIYSLNLSHNHLSGFEGSYPLLKQSLQFLDLRFNQLTGSLPIPSTNSSLQYYLVSNNQFSGEIPTKVCDLVNLSILDISNNNLSGMVPQCLIDLVGMGNLSVLDLHNNNFSGSMPPIGKNRCNLVMIDMSYNQLGGQVPREMENCIDLEFLNLGNNKITDVFPFWLGKLPKLSILILHTNRFRGIIEKPLGGYMFPKLQIIDLSINYFTGRLSTLCFEVWGGMESKVDKEDRTMSYASDRRGYYFYTLKMTNKGISIEYTKVPESLMGVDLSSNHFTEEIPESIATLKGLNFLNLSNNMLTGSIPFNLSSLSNLESLDLSHNNLSGEIPQQLTDLTMLECFDVSFNQLIGPIPQSKQFNTFENSSYEGNSGLCGLPLSKKCGDIIEASPPSSLEKDRASRTWFEIDWKIVSMGYTSGFVIGVVMGMNWTRGCKKVKRVRQIKFVLN